MSTVTDERPSLRTNREFWLLWVGQASSTLGSASSTLAMPLLVLALTGSPPQAGLVGLVTTGSKMVGLLPAGVVADRVDRRGLMRWCDAGRAAAMAALALTLALSRPSLIELLGLALVDGSLHALFLAAHSGAVRYVVAGADVPAAVARNQGYQQAALVGGPPLGGLLYAAGWALPFVTDALSYLISYLTITAIRVPLQEPRGQSAPPGEPLRRRVLQGLRWVLEEPFLRAALLYVTGLVFVSAALVLTVIVRARTHGATTAEVGVIFAVSGVGGVAGALAASRIQQRWAPGALLLAIGAICVVAVLMLTTTTRPILLGAILAVIGFLTPPLNTIIISYQMRATPDRLQGQAYAAMILITGSSAPLSSLTSGLLLTVMSSTGALLVLTAVTIIVVGAGSASTTLRTSGRINTLGAQRASVMHRPVGGDDAREGFPGPPRARPGR